MLDVTIETKVTTWAPPIRNGITIEVPQWNMNGPQWIAPKHCDLPQTLAPLINRNNISFVNSLRFPEQYCEIKNLMTGKRQPGCGYMVRMSIMLVMIKTSLLLLIRARELVDDIEFMLSKVHNITTFAGSMMWSSLCNTLLPSMETTN